MSSDYAAMLDEDSGRVDLDEPASSLLLEKPSLVADHEGGKRFAEESVAYQVVHRWIREGAAHRRGSGDLLRVECTPRHAVLYGTSPELPFHVHATFADGTREDITALCELRCRDETVATIDDHGIVRRVGPGDTAVIAVYRGHPASMSLLVPNTDVEVGAEAKDPACHEQNVVDRFVLGKLRSLRMEPSSVSSDVEFLRRVTLATIGQLPTPDEIRRFVSDSDRDKRSRRIDSLLANPLHASLWATRMCEITGSRDGGSDRMGDRDSRLEWKWHEWFRQRFAANSPYDQIARDILCATGRERREMTDYIDAVATAGGLRDDVHALASHYAQRQTLDLFWRRPLVNEEIEVDELAERISAAFLGVRMECARCHKHPFDRWTQNDHRSLTNVFTQVRLGMSPNLRSAMVDLLEEQRRAREKGASPRRIPSMREIYVTSLPADRIDTTSQTKLAARPLGGRRLASTDDRRVPFAEWLTGPDNPFFARNFVNRVWAVYFGVGLVEPVDAFSAANPPSHPEMLDTLAREFIEGGFDVKRLEKRILTSRTWQQTSMPTPSNQSDRRNFARTYVVPLRAETLVDAIQAATGSSFGLVSPSRQLLRAVEIPVARTGNKLLDTWFEVFDRPQRKLTCDCEQRAEPNLRQAMLLLSDPKLLTQIRAGGLNGLLQGEPSDDELIDELFLRTVSRWPSDAESGAAKEVLHSSSDRLAAGADIIWSLINTREFVTNH